MNHLSIHESDAACLAVALQVMAYLRRFKVLSTGDAQQRPARPDASSAAAASDDENGSSDEEDTQVSAALAQTALVALWCWLCGLLALPGGWLGNSLIVDSSASASGLYRCHRLSSVLLLKCCYT